MTTRVTPNHKPNFRSRGVPGCHRRAAEGFRCISGAPPPPPGRFPRTSRCWEALAPRRALRLERSREMAGEREETIVSELAFISVVAGMSKNFLRVNYLTHIDRFVN